MKYVQHELYPQYESFWQRAWPRIRAGDTESDPCVFRKDQDLRRGMTVIARLAPDVTQRIRAFLDTMQALDPQQYYYPSTDIHLTVLSLFTATEQHHNYLAHAAAYTEVATEACSAISAFMLDTVGITVSPGAVMMQGFPHNHALQQLRDALRAGLIARGLHSGLDQRYRLQTAHNTVIRFAAPLAEPEQYAEALQSYRHVIFGTSHITALDLVINDWYMSADRLTVLQKYRLMEGGGDVCECTGLDRT